MKNKNSELIALLESISTTAILRKDLTKLVKDAGHDESFAYPALRVSGASITRGTYSVAIMLKGLENPTVKKAKSATKKATPKTKKVAKKAKGKKTAPKVEIDVDAEIAAEIADEVNAADLDENTDVDIEWTEDELGDEVSLDELVCYS